MALAFALIAIVLLDVAFRNTQGALSSQLSQDGPGYAIWAVAIVFVGLLSYLPDFQTPGHLLLVLVIVAIVIANKGAFANIQSTFTGSPQSVQVTANQPVTGTPQVDVALTAGGSSAGGSSAGGVAGTALSLGSDISTLTGGFFGGLL